MITHPYELEQAQQRCEQFARDACQHRQHQPLASIRVTLLQQLRHWVASRPLLFAQFVFNRAKVKPHQEQADDPRIHYTTAHS